MTGDLPHLDDLALLGLRHRTMAAHARVRAQVKDYSARLDPVAGEEVWQVRHLLALVQCLKIMVVLKERLVLQRAWPELAVELGMDEPTARRIYEDMERRWVGGDMSPWAPRPVEEGGPQGPKKRRLRLLRW